MGLALFDLDNTLLDREAAFRRWSQGFIRRYGLPQEAWSFMESVDQDGMTPKTHFFSQVQAEFNVPGDIETLVANYYQDYPAYFTVDSQTVDGLRQLHARGWRTGVVTNGGPKQLAKLEATKLVGEFDAICPSGIVGVSKPDPAIFEFAAELCRCPLEGWMTGDSVNADIAGGRGVGLRTIWIARGRSWTSADPAPDAVVSTVREAIKMILGSDPRTPSSP